MKRFFIKTASMLALTISCAAAPALAQNESASAEATAKAQAAALDPARLKAAQATVDYLFPLGTYERMMKGTMNQMMESMMSSMGGMTMGDLAGAAGVADEDIPEGESEKTFAEISKERDPHYEERMKITTNVMMDEMVDLMTSMEPAIRDSLIKIYARKYTAPQLAEMNAFFATDTGGAFARDYMMVFVDPEMMESMMKMVPEMMGAMPEIMKKVEEATAHLPPVKMDDPLASIEDIMEEAEGAEAACDAAEDCEVSDAADPSDPANWTKEDRERVEKLMMAYDDASEKYYEAAEEAEASARERMEKTSGKISSE